MFDKILFRVVAPIILVIFTFTTCASPFVGGSGETPDPVPATPQVPEEIKSVKVGEGTPAFMFLDEDYQIAEGDTGIIGMVVEDNA